MLFYSVEEFFRYAKKQKRLTREEELRLAAAAKNGDESGFKQLADGYLPVVAGVIGRQKPETQTLRLVMRCCMFLEREIGRFDFFQESEPFLHRLSWALRQAVVREIAEQGIDKKELL